jgi:hypothetical protein
MASVELTNEQVAELVRQLPAKAKREVLLALAGDAQARRGERMALAAAQLRQLAADRGLDWDAMSDDQRQALVDDLIHEDRPCQP